MQVRSGALVGEIKAALAVRAKCGFGSEHMTLMYGGKPLDDGEMLKEYGIARGGTINVMWPLRGGTDRNTAVLF